MRDKNNFFQKQGDRDCTLVSFNNAVGYKVIKKKELNREIEKRVEKFAQYVGLPLSDEAVSRFRDSMVINGNRYTPFTVWSIAKQLGMIPEMPQRVYSMNSLGRYIILGRRITGENHAVGCRNGKIYDSLLSDNPVDLNLRNLQDIFKNPEDIYGIYSVVT